MHADELRQAVTKIVELLARADIRSVLDRYRSTRGDERTVAAARLGHAGAMVMNRLQALSPAERRVARTMHLEELSTSAFWDSLLAPGKDPKVHQGELVRLASRIMFATGQLPTLLALLEPVREPTPIERYPLANGEGRLVIRLVDAGEKAADPDRIARSIDGVDMLYSACASIASRPAIDLRLDGIDGTRQRDLHFTGERDSLSAVIAVIESIPGALADIDPSGEVDLNRVVGSLPVFADLDKLSSMGAFSSRDMKDIHETMHQGALLVLESGVVLVDESTARRPGAGSGGAGVGVAATPAGGTPPAAGGAPATSAPVSSADVRPDEGGDGAPAGGDEHYERYLREREAMQRSADQEADGDSIGDRRRDAVEELLRSLEQSRNGR